MHGGAWHDAMPKNRTVRKREKQWNKHHCRISFVVSPKPPALMLNEYPALDFQDETDNLKTVKHERPPQYGSGIGKPCNF